MGMNPNNIAFENLAFNPVNLETAESDRRSG